MNIEKQFKEFEMLREIDSNFEQKRTAILVSCTEALEQPLLNLVKSIKESSTSSDNLSKRIFFLNIILTSATVIGVIISLFALFNNICHWFW